MNENILHEMRDRNIQRAKELINKMGTKYALHPENRVIRKDRRPGVLEIPNYLFKK